MVIFNWQGKVLMGGVFVWCVYALSIAKFYLTTRRIDNYNIIIDEIMFEWDSVKAEA